MEAPLNKFGGNEDRGRDFSRKRKALAPWRFQTGYKRWPDGIKARKTLFGDKFDCVEDLAGLNGENENSKNFVNARDNSKGEASNRNTINHEKDLGGANAKVPNGETSNHVNDSGNIDKSDGFNDSSGMNSKFENGEASNPEKDSGSLAKKRKIGRNRKQTEDRNGLNECTDKTQIMSKLHKAVAPWRFQIGYKRPFSKESLNKYMVETPYPSRKYPSSVRVSASCKFSPNSGTESKNNSSRPTSSSNFANTKNDSTRDNAMTNLRKFQCIYRELQAKEAVKKTGAKIDIDALRVFREKNELKEEIAKCIGTVPGTKIGDSFQLLVELCVVGLHSHSRSNVDFIKHGDEIIATSVIPHDNYPDFRKKFKLDVVEFKGSSMGIQNSILEGSNLALIKSMQTKIPVRLIYRFTKYFAGTQNQETKGRKLSTYIYCGLYRVEQYWKKSCYIFKLKRVEGQPDLDIRSILESRRPEKFLFPAFFLEDMSFGKEKVPISVVNYIDSEKPPFYNYITTLKMKTRSHRDPCPLTGCNCLNGCSDSNPCACMVKNGGELPFNHMDLIIEAKPLVYECGPFCKCPPSCPNRVTQHGMKCKLQVFKTEKMGWGVRALHSIPSGSFICEYIGELLNDEEAQKRENDEYLFSIGNNYFDEELWKGLKTSIPALRKNKKSKKRKMENFAIDASEFGNFAKFINHSCMPNCYAQNVLYDHENLSMPRVMFFASEDIQPMEELTYHYNYCVDQVYDANGNVKKKKCFCGTEECTGWLY